MTKDSILVFKNGYIVTMNEKQPKAEAMVVKGNKILAIGSNDTILSSYKSNKIIDLEGKFVCPGFYDAHTHLLAIASKFDDVILDKVTSVEEALEKIKARVDKTPKGKWIFGERWDESNWTEKRYITREDLDKIAPDNPCYIRRVCGHLIAVNTLALKELEISFDDPDLEIDSDTRKPTGILYDELINRLSSNPKLKKSQSELDKAVMKACRYANSLGVTSIVDNLNIYAVRSYITAWRKKELTLRVTMNIPRNKYPKYLELGLGTGFGDSKLQFGAIKIFTDGSIGSRTAALTEPYYDEPSIDGNFYIEKKEFTELIRNAVENDWQTATHAIGDRAIEFVIEAFEKIKKPEIIARGRHRIEHAEYLSEDLLQRVNKLGLILSMQPNFPGRWGRPGQLYELKLGPKRYKLLNNFRKILDSKAKLCFGSDNMPMAPLFGIWSVLTHEIEDINITVDEAIYCYTLGAAYATFEEELKGSLEIGKLADFIILDKNLHSVDVDVIKDVQVLQTYFDGKLVYRKN